jgi:hypothetical protein
VASHHQEYDWEKESDVQPASDNLLPPILGLIGIGALALATWALGLPGGPSGDEFSNCATITDNHTRLACYDQLAGPRPPAKGALAPFNIHPREDAQ